MNGSVLFAKRVIDILTASVGILVAAPVFALVALAVKLDSRGPVFYSQRRAGRLVGRDANGAFLFEEFTMWKFRTMCVDAERATGPVLASKDDPRVTRVGRFLRKSRLDELPQLFNVLGGSMSMVGPRPERPELMAILSTAVPMFEERMRDLKPGITGLAQTTLGYGGEPPPDHPIVELLPSLLPPVEGHPLANDMVVKLVYDLAYAAAATSLPRFLAMELRVIAKTPLVMLRGVGR